MDFLTPEFFNTIIVINLLVGVLLAIYRFYRDMTLPLPDDQREQAYDESSAYVVFDDSPSDAAAQAMLDDESDAAQKRQNR